MALELYQKSKKEYRDSWGRQGYRHLDDFRGLALKNIRAIRKMPLIKLPV